MASDLNTARSIWSWTDEDWRAFADKLRSAGAASIGLYIGADPETRVSDHVDDAQTPSAQDIAVAAQAFADFMAALGYPAEGDHLSGTPLRVAKMYAELLHGNTDWDFTIFRATSDDMVLVRDIPFTSFCAHHFLPFTGVAHVAYIPDGQIAGLSKLARMVALHAAAPQVQEGLTEEIAEDLTGALATSHVAVVIEARHSCMELRGAKAVGALTITAALRGDFRDDPQTRAEFYALINRGAR